MVTDISPHNMKYPLKLHSCMSTINSQGYSRWLQCRPSRLTREVRTQKHIIVYLNLGTATYHSHSVNMLHYSRIWDLCHRAQIILEF